MPLLSLFKRDKASAARSRSRASVNTAGSSTDLHDGYVLPPIPSSHDSWTDASTFATANTRPPSTLRLVSPTPTRPLPHGSSLPALNYPFPDSAATLATTQSLQATSPPKSQKLLTKTPQTPSSKSVHSATIPHPKRPSFFSWASSKSTKSSSKSTDSNPSKHAKLDESNDLHSFNLKSFRHIAPPLLSIPPLLPQDPPMLTPSPAIPPQRPSEQAVAPRTNTSQVNTGFQVTSRPRGNSTHSIAESSSSQTVTVSAFRQAARRSATNLVASPFEDFDDLPNPPTLFASDRPTASPLRTNTPPSSFRGSMENSRSAALTPTSSGPNPTPLQSITGATRRYSGALSSGPNGNHVRQPALISSASPKRQVTSSLPSNATESDSSADQEEPLYRQTTITQSTVRATKARSELGHGTLQDTPPSTPKANVNARLPTLNSNDSTIAARDSFYKRQRASLSTGALPTGVAQVRRSTAPNVDTATGKGRVAAQWHDTDTSEEDTSDSDSSGDNTPLVTYMTKSKGSSAIVAETAQTGVQSKPPQRKRALVDINAPSTFNSSDKIRSKRNASLGRTPSLRSSRSEENLPATSSKSYAGPMRPAKPPSSSSQSSHTLNTDRPSVLTGTRSRPMMPTSTTDPHLGPNRMSRSNLFPGTRPFRDSPTSSTSNGGDSSSGIVPLTPRDGSEIGTTRPTHRKSSSVTFADQVDTKDKDLERQSPRGNMKCQEEVRRRERRRSEAKNAITLGNVVNGPGPIADSDDEEYPMHPGMSMPMQIPGPNQFPSHPGDMWNMWSRQSTMNPMPMPMPNPQQFMVPTGPSGTDMRFLAAHQQAMTIAKQTYQMAVAQQAMAAAADEWERSSNVGGMPGWGGGSVMFPGGSRSVYGGSVIGGPASSYGGGGSGWGSRSVYGESFGPSMPRNSFVGQPPPIPPMPPSSFNRSAGMDGPPRQRARSGVQEAAGPPSSWKKR